jgi:transposase
MEMNDMDRIRIFRQKERVKAALIQTFGPEHIRIIEKQLIHADNALINGATFEDALTITEQKTRITLSYYSDPKND